jgi:hypothetical protein
MASERKNPTGKERMLRSPPKDPRLRPERFEFDLEKAYTSEQLARIGAIALTWNRIEQRIEFLMMMAFQDSFPSWRIWSEIQQGISKLDRRISLLREISDESDILTAEAKSSIKNAFDAVFEYRRYRNAIVHSYVFDHKNGIATHVDHAHKPWQVLLTIDALNVLYDNLLALDVELMEIDLLFRMAGGHGRVIVNDPKTGRPERDQAKALRERAVPDQTKKVIVNQKKRKVLPTFPDAHLMIPKVGVIKMTPED